MKTLNQNEQVGQEVKNIIAATKAKWTQKRLNALTRRMGGKVK